MQPRRHIPSDRPCTLANCDLPMWCGDVDQEAEVECPYCGCSTDPHHDPGCWKLSFEDFKAAFARMNVRREYGYPRGHLHSILRGDILERKVCLHICPKCGWWIAEDRAVLPAVAWQHWAVTLASAPAMLDLRLDNVELPIQEVRRYLVRRFDQRATMHPRLFELTVASVFADWGYKALATAYSRDGGIDVILSSGSEERIGVQVKRQKNSVSVEQIRAFLGALVLGGFRRGVFVAASRLRNEAVRAARTAEVIAPIELVDCERFFDALGCAQLSQAPAPDQCIDGSRPLTFHTRYCHHLDTL